MFLRHQSSIKVALVYNKIVELVYDDVFNIVEDVGIKIFKTEIIKKPNPINIISNMTCTMTLTHLVFQVIC